MALRTKVVGGALLLAGLVVVFWGAYAAPRVGAALAQREEEHLRGMAEAARLRLEVAPDLEHAAPGLAREMSVTLGPRFTIFDASGRPLGDSLLPPEALGRLSPLGERPEVTAVLGGASLGRARRYSATAEARYLYVAIPVRGGVLRLGVPEVSVSADGDGALGALANTAALSAAAVLLAAALAWTLAARAVRGIVGAARQKTRSLAEGVPVPARGDELEGLQGSLDAMAKRLEDTLAALAHEKNQIQGLLESMGEAVLALDASQRVTLANRAALGLVSQPPVGRLLLEVMRVPRLQDLVARAESGEVAEGELELVGPPPRRVMARAAPLPRGMGTVIVLHDVTELRRLETVRTDFVANASHELRTPVSVIRANAETLLDGAFADPVRGPRFLEALALQADRLAALVNDLLDISRLESGNYQLELSPLRLAPAVQAVVEGLAARAKAKGMRVESKVGEELGVQADAGALHQILDNLVDNAIKYTHAGGNVEISATRQGKEVLLAVRDDGPGIEPRFQGRIFERFFRVDPGRSREMGGTGLGLAIVKHLAEAMGGSVGVAAREPRGTEIWVRLQVGKENPST